MSFRWNLPMLVEDEIGEAPPLWIYVLLFLIFECVALGLTVATWPKGKPLDSWEFCRGVVLLGPLFWIAFCAFLYHTVHGQHAFETAVINQEAWRHRRSWQRDSRSGVGVLESVILAPVPDLAERMLGLEGTPPQNPGKVMALDSPDAEEAETRLHGVLQRLLTPLIPKLVQAEKSCSFLLLMHGDRDESSETIFSVWKKLELPGHPRIVRMSDDTEPKFAEKWFAADDDPSYRLVLAWHLNDNLEAPHDCSEFAVALLLGSHQFLYNQRDRLRPQAWLLRGIEAEADQVENALSSLLGAEQVDRKRVHQFWHSGLKGLAQHATVGAVRESGLEAATHVLETAVGPQAPASRWLVYALAARMAHFGQGGQLVALPGQKGVTLNFAAKELQATKLPWKASYDYSIVPLAEWIFVTAVLGGVFLLDDSKEWSGFATAVIVLWLLALAGFLAARIFRAKQLVSWCWQTVHAG